MASGSRLIFEIVSVNPVPTSSCLLKAIVPAPKLTPAMAQYMQFKRQHNDAILFFRMGDFYEMFYDDAVEASKLLGLTLTARNHSKSSGSVPLAGVPHHAADSYLAKLVRLGRKVAICEQVEDPKKAKGVVKRDVVQVVSPGTVLSDTVLDQQQNNFLVSLHSGDERTGLAIVDLSTGDFTLNELAAEDVWGELEILAPAEFLIGAGVGEEWVEKMRVILPGTAVSRIDDWHFEFNSAYESLTTQLEVQSLKGYDAEDLRAAICAGGAAVDYLRDNQRGTIAHINRIQLKRPSDFLMLDATAQRNLELLSNQHDGKREGSLLEVLDQTRTPMGARLLRKWIVAPLRDTSAIVDRQDAIAALFETEQHCATLRELMGGIGDLERVMARICCQRANARDLVALAVSLQRVEEIRSSLAALQGSLLETLRSSGLPDIDPLVSELSDALVDEPPLLLSDGGLIRDGYNEKLDELRRASRGGKKWIADQQTHERQRTGISSLKIGYNQVFGYYLEVSKANLDRVPEEYVRKQTLANAERYITSELKECEARVLGAEEKIAQLEGELFVELRSRAAEWAEPVQRVARTVAQIDVLCSLTEVARGSNYVRPELDSSSVIEIVGGRHPVVENLSRDGRFVPNDLLLDGNGEQILLITGPNMAGKSTIIRQVGLIVLMAQMGSYVAAEHARIGVVDRIFTRVGAADNLAPRREHLYGGNERGFQYSQQRHVAKSHSYGRTGTRNEHLRRVEHRMGGSGIPARSGTGKTAHSVCDPLPRAHRAGRSVGARQERQCHGAGRGRQRGFPSPAGGGSVRSELWNSCGADGRHARCRRSPSARDPERS